MKWASYKKGFTVVEILVVVVVVAILSGILVVGYQAVTRNADTSAGLAAIRQAEDSLKLWSLNNNGARPATIEETGYNNTGNKVFYYAYGTDEYCLSSEVSKGVDYYTFSGQESAPTAGSCKDISWVAGAPLGFNDKPNTVVNLTQTATQATDITMYAAFTVINTTAAYDSFGALTPLTGTNGYRFQNGAAASTSTGYRLDTSTTSNLTSAQTARTAGFHVGWIQTRSNTTIREFAFDKSTNHNSLTIPAGGVWNFTGISLPAANASTTPRAVVVYSGVHSTQTRSAIIAWLTELYGP